MEQLEMLSAELMGLEVGSVHVRKFRGGYESADADGDPLVRVQLTLDDPVGETWDADDLEGLRSTISQRARAIGLPSPIVELYPETESDDHPSESVDEEALGRALDADG